MKCSKCDKKIETTFLNKIVGTILTEGKKKEYICSQCQRLISKK